jgi:hypothetical protein
MLKFSEALLQFIWQHRLLKPVPFVTRSGNEVVVLKPGTLNRHAGPDFFNAQIGLNGVVLAGNIEIHLKTSDWLKHRHEQDRSYDYIILHVVYEHDMDLPQNTDHQVEVLELRSLIEPRTLEEYRLLAESQEKLACASQLKQVNNLKFTAWMERMAIERLEEKTKRIEDLFNTFQGDYTQVFYSILLRNFGFQVNALPFELMAKYLPVHLLLKHADNLLQLEALFLGVAGFLESSFNDKYMHGLQNEFDYLKNKYRLNTLNSEIFKFSRLRPANFPTLRLVQLAALIHTSTKLITAPQELCSTAQIKKALQIKLQGYWQHRYLPDGNVTDQELGLGEASAEGIIVNTFAPFFFFYSKKLIKPEYADLALDLLQDAGFEANAKSRLFSAKKEVLLNAADSQGIINLYDHYCSKKQCLSCGVAAALLNPS